MMSFQKDYKYKLCFAKPREKNRFGGRRMQNAKKLNETMDNAYPISRIGALGYLFAIFIVVGTYKIYACSLS